MTPRDFEGWPRVTLDYTGDLGEGKDEGEDVRQARAEPPSLAEFPILDEDHLADILTQDELLASPPWSLPPELRNVQYDLLRSLVDD